MLFAVPNVSEGRHGAAIIGIEQAFAAPAGVKLLDTHYDRDHHRSVFWLAGEPGRLAEALVQGAKEAAGWINLQEPRGVHPHVGALDVAPIVYARPEDRGAACAEALLAAGRLGEEAGLPVYLYGELAGGRTRAELRRGGLKALRTIPPDFGPREPDPKKGAVLVAARPPLVAFNFEIEGDEALARSIAAEIRELPGVRALGLWLDSRSVAQVSVNVEEPDGLPLATLLEEVRSRARVRETELVGLAPAEAFAGWPRDVAIRNRRTIEDALGS
jgi:glutamate formiminotransferase/glutamate formiminotransferase/formiminotetrahydrofolate cyclodeaminase